MTMASNNHFSTSTTPQHASSSTFSSFSSLSLPKQNSSIHTFHESFESDEESTVIDDTVGDASRSTMSTASFDDSSSLLLQQEEPLTSPLLNDSGDDDDDDDDDDVSDDSSLVFDKPSSSMSSSIRKAPPTSGSSPDELLNRSLTFADYYEDEDDEDQHQHQQNKASTTETTTTTTTTTTSTTTTAIDVPPPSPPPPKALEASPSTTRPAATTAPSKPAPQAPPLSPKQHRRAQFAGIRTMSVARLETALDTLVKASAKEDDYQMLNNGSCLRFGFVLHQDFDKAAPACQIIEGCLERMDEWCNNANEPLNDGDTLVVKTKPKKNRQPKVLKSILKKVKRRLSGISEKNEQARIVASNGGRRRGSFFGNQQVQSSAPKCPGRRGSMEPELTDFALVSPPRRRGSFWGSSVGASGTSITTASTDMNSSSSHSQTPQAPRRRGSFLSGWGSSNISNNYVAAQKSQPVQAPARPQRRLSWLGGSGLQAQAQDPIQAPSARLGRRRSFLGGNYKSNNDDNAAAKAEAQSKPRRRLSFLGGGRRLSLSNTTTI